eukprot:6466464-Amphidinium_carterae.2
MVSSSAMVPSVKLMPKMKKTKPNTRKTSQHCARGNMLGPSSWVSRSAVEDPHKRNHRVEDGRYHHPQLTEESHHSNDAHHPNDAHDTKNAEDGYVRHSFSQCHCFQHDFHPAQ